MSRAARDPRDGSRKWTDPEGRPHREEGPALEFPDGEKYWFRHGVAHREDGPAWEGPDGTARKHSLRGVITRQEFVDGHGVHATHALDDDGVLHVHEDGAWVMSVANASRGTNVDFLDPASCQFPGPPGPRHP